MSRTIAEPQRDGPLSTGPRAASEAAAAGSLAALPALGVGLAFREPLRGELFRRPRAVDFLEITADHYFDATPGKLAELDLLREHFVLIPHGLDLSLGSAEGLDPAYLQQSAALVQRVRPPWWSEHIAFTRAGGVRIGHLAPLPFTREAASALAENVAAARRAIPSPPLILENITYSLEVAGVEMDELAFVSTVLETCDCGWLLDVTNLYSNAVNRGIDPLSLLDRAPLERVVQLHFVGGRWHDGRFIDDHSSPTPEPIWEVLEAVCARAPVKGVILERDEEIPSLTALAEELARAREILRKHGRWA